MAGAAVSSSPIAHRPLGTCNDRIVPKVERSGLAGAVERSVWLAAVFGGAIWVAEMARVSAGMNLSGRSAQVSSAAVLLAAGAVVAIAVQRRVTVLAFGLTLLAAIAALSVIDINHGQSILKPIYAWATPVLIIPAALRLRSLAIVLIGSAGAVLLIELTIVVPASSLSWSRSFFVIVWGIVVGLFVLWLITALRRAAAATDASTQARLDAYRLRTLETERARQGARLSRLLHDTLINTMGAIRDGVAPDLVPQLRDRCRVDLARVAAASAGGLDAAVSGSESVDELVVALRELARMRGLHLESEVVGGDTRFPRAITQSVPDICAEAMTNIGKHSGRTDASLRIVGLSSGFTLNLRDAGVGFDIASVQASGIEGSMRTRAAEAGIDLTIDSELGVGTVISLAWRSDEPSAAMTEDLQERKIFPFRGGAMLWLLCSLAALQALVQAPGQSWTDVTWYCVGALTIGLALWIAVGQSKSTRGLGAAGALALAGAGAFATWASAVGIGLCSPDPNPWVGSTGVLIAICALTVLTRQLWWLAVAWAAGLVATSAVAVAGQGPGCSASVSILDGSQVIAFVLGLVFVWAASNAQRRFTQAQVDLRAATKAVALERAKSGRTERRLSAAMAIAEPLFTQIESGESEESDLETRVVAGRHEVTLRSIAQLPDLPDQLDQQLLDVLCSNDVRGVATKLWFTGDVFEIPSEQVQEELVKVVNEVSAELTTGDRLALHFVVAGGTGELRLAADTTTVRELGNLDAKHVALVSATTDDQLAVIASW